ncbi:MAG: methylmalonyl-CoA mutase family protein [Gammaproteobacteria bacterium]|nr:methylmalonyl-CoA mutase family protein [Gammaproteobacteria bacterium]
MSTPAASLSTKTDVQPLRFITAASLFDGHDASINIMRRILQSKGAEVVHLGHNRSVEEIVTAAIQEDAHGIAISSYQGGHVEFFKYMIDMLRERGATSIAVFGGGGGVIIPEEIQELHDYGVARIYSPQDGQALGLTGMIDHMLATTAQTVAASLSDTGVSQLFTPSADSFGAKSHLPLARLISQIENGLLSEADRSRLMQQSEALTKKGPVLGITGTGGAGKSSVTDEIIRRLRLDQDNTTAITLLAIDPTRQRSGGALLGDRIRMNAIEHEKVFMRSLATRNSVGEVPEVLPEMIAACRLAGADIVIVETPGIGQGSAGIVPYCDVSLYVMTPEFGAASQLEKIDMLDFADLVAINKYDRSGGEDALRDVRKQLQRNREAFDQSVDDMPVFGTIASRFNDDGVTALYQALAAALTHKGWSCRPGSLPKVSVTQSSRQQDIIPAARRRYLSEISDSVREHHANAMSWANLVRERQHLNTSANLLGDGAPAALAKLIAERSEQLPEHVDQLLSDWPAIVEQYNNRDDRHFETLSGTLLNRVSLPHYSDHGDLLCWLLRENLPGHFPFTAGVFPFKRRDEDPTRMFAGEGNAARTNARFKALSEHSDAKRLSTAFDSVTLYGNDPAVRPDIYGKVGNSGVSIATVDDMEVLYDGFDLCDPKTSVSMTINGPAPTILAFYFVTAVRQQLAKFEQAHGRQPDTDEYHQLREKTFSMVRGTVQADILKEDQGQNTCIFSTEFSLRMMADIQSWFIEHNVRNFYSVSISGYHIAEAGANPITQLALTLSNGFTYVENYLSRGMDIDDFAPSLSFFFSNGMDPEYTVLGRVARRIWAVAMRDRYGASERSQKLKYHIQTSGRSLHAQEMSFNDIRTTLQALIAIYDNCNSLHTNAYNEAITTPTDESVRRAVAIQLIINREWGLARNENPNQGSFVVEELTDLVEEAVLCEFDRLSERGGVLGAMETGYQRGKIQDESMLYEHRKHDGSLPIIGVNTFLDPAGDEQDTIELARSSDAEKQSQVSQLAAFHARHAASAPESLRKVQQAAMAGENVFAELVEAAEHCSLGQLTEALFAVGGQYRRNL